ncbi:MAG: hypothetical protein ABSA67_16840 [Candidatus Brocadiia bacterium]|jgi:L-lactate utilization protein LutC
MASDGYEVKKGIIGKPKVAYQCAKCHNDLESDLTDAGKKDTCPLCKAVFIVPGQRELQEMQDAAKQAEEERLQAAARRQLREKTRQQMIAEEAARRSEQMAAAETRRLEEKKRHEDETCRKQQAQSEKDLSGALNADHAGIATSLSRACGRVFKPVFFLGEIFSVFIIAICSLAIAAVLVYLVFVIRPETQPVPPEPSPQAEQCRQYFIALHTPTNDSAPANRPRQPAEGRRAKKENIKLAIENLRAKYHSPDERSLADTLTEEIERLPQHHVDRVLLGLDSFLNETLKTSLVHSDKEVNLWDAMGWYVSEYVEGLDNINAVEKENLVAMEVARAKRLQAAEVVGGAFLVLMGFLIFPLLLRIERNTRALATDVQNKTKSKES